MTFDCSSALPCIRIRPCHDHALQLLFLFLFLLFHTQRNATQRNAGPRPGRSLRTHTSAPACRLSSRPSSHSHEDRGQDRETPARLPISAVPRGPAGRRIAYPTHHVAHRPALRCITDFTGRRIVSHTSHLAVPTACMPSPLFSYPHTMEELAAARRLPRSSSSFYSTVPYSPVLLVCMYSTPPPPRYGVCQYST